MAAERDFELLDDLIRNRLKGEDKAYIENRLKQDPELQREYALQQHIAEGIRASRRAELKAMLNAVPVPSAGGSSTFAKIAGAGSVAVILGLAVFVYVSSEKTDSTIDDQVIIPTQEEKNYQPVDEPTVSSETDHEPSATVPAFEKTERKSTEAATKQADTKVIAPYDPAEETEGGYNTTQPESNASSVTATTRPQIASRIERSDKYKFHYQLVGDEVTLYGPFEENLYTIMDFKFENKRAVFLHYNNNYYLLSETASIKPLSPVNDPALLKTLRSRVN